MDLYIVLGVPHGASDSDIKRAYRRLARRYHPDINPGDQTAEERFRQILEAYETLIDPSRRSRYDAGHRVEVGPGRQAAGFEGFDFSTRGADYSATFGDLFAEVLTERGGRAPTQQRGADLHVEMPVTFEEALTGTSACDRGHAPRELSQLRRRRADASEYGFLSPLSGHRGGAFGAWAHGVLACVQRLWRHRSADAQGM